MLTLSERWFLAGQIFAHLAFNYIQKKDVLHNIHMETVEQSEDNERDVIDPSTPSEETHSESSEKDEEKDNGDLYNIIMRSAGSLRKFHLGDVQAIVNSLASNPDINGKTLALMLTLGISIRNIKHSAFEIYEPANLDEEKDREEVGRFIVQTNLTGCNFDYRDRVKPVLFIINTEFMDLYNAVQASIDSVNGECILLLVRKIFDKWNIRLDDMIYLYCRYSYNIMKVMHPHRLKILNSSKRFTFSEYAVRMTGRQSIAKILDRPRIEGVMPCRAPKNL